MNRLIYELLLLFLIAVTQTSFADRRKVLCVYETPTAQQEPIYNDVLEGIKNKTRDLQKQILLDNTDLLKQQITQANPDIIIALGKNAAETVAALPFRNKTIAGLFSFKASAFNGVSLSLSDKAVAARLNHFMPGIRRIFIIQERGHKTIETDTGFQSPDLNIVTFDGNDSLSTIRELGRIVENVATSFDAVFLPPNLPDEILFKIGLTAWDKNIKLFSTNMWHLENGALMVFYPNATALGEQIGNLTSKNIPAYETVAKIDVALNRRIAQHLELQFVPSIEALFAVTIK
ncbi:MAG: hypothetical protein KGZ71_14040 [Desulfobulbaceae bacterium]|nr:hypothetical protein [Desulfobulbaceae bacterium]